MLKFGTSFENSTIIDTRVDTGFSSNWHYKFKHIYTENSHVTIIYDISDMTSNSLPNIFCMIKCVYKLEHSMNLVFDTHKSNEYWKFKKYIFGEIKKYTKFITGITIHSNEFVENYLVNSLDELIEKYNEIKFWQEIVKIEEPFISNRKQYLIVKEEPDLYQITFAKIVEIDFYTSNLNSLINFLNNNKTIQVIVFSHSEYKLNNVIEYIIKNLTLTLLAVIIDHEYYYIANKKYENILNAYYTMCEYNLDIDANFIEPENDAETKYCKICGFSLNTIVLPCGNTYHKTCLSEFLDQL